MIDRKGMIRGAYQDHLMPGKKYRVAQTFLDARKSVHHAGETFTYWGYLPSGFVEATAIFATNDRGDESTFAIDWNSTENNLGLENLNQYIQEASE